MWNSDICCQISRIIYKDTVLLPSDCFFVLVLNSAVIQKHYAGEAGEIVYTLVDIIMEQLTELVRRRESRSYELLG